MISVSQSETITAWLGLESCSHTFFGVRNWYWLLALVRNSTQVYI